MRTLGKAIRETHLMALISHPHFITIGGLIMKIKKTITNEDLDACYDLLIATVSIMLLMAIVWKVIA